MTRFASSTPTIPRRRFLQISATSAGGLLIAGWLPSCHRTSPTAVAAPFKPNPFLQIDPDETVHIWAPRPDVGEGTKTSLPLLVADELEADWSRVRVHQADLDSAAFGDQGVGGSDSVQSMIDELAHASRVDPLELQSRLLGNASDFPYPGRSSSGLYNPDRLKAVLSLAAVSAGWGTKLSPRRGRGIAAHHTNNSYAAYVIEVEVDPSRRLAIRRVVVAIDCGTPVNRSGIEAQAQGGTLDGLSAALFGEITLARGRSVQDNFTNYRWLRNHEAPAIQVHLVESREAPTGLGEIPYPPVAPALTNAIFSAIGERIRRLPLSRHGFTLAT